ncbi:MCE family protein [Dokdonia sinensis]|uniref:MCE family protein n=1 Tax=Dokdonia sinensis TaxID=2479847 RepID=A0A3M0GE47_9FLAO|nr:MlaD family protein [Dokdonia sinensis]RMB60912.1 MCE family protein [Dokdonia sinensis]
MKISREVKTAILMIVSIALLIFGYQYLKGQNLLDKSRTFYAIYDNVEGLAPASAVTINGLKVGKVLDIGFADQQGKLLVTFTVEKDFEFSKKSVARIYGGGLIGGKSLSIIPDYSGGVMAKDGDTLLSESSEGIMELVNERLTPLQEKVEAVIVDADSVLTNVNAVLDIDTRANLRAAIADFTSTATSLKGISRSMNSMLSENEDKLNRTFTNLDKMSANFVTISDSLSNVDVGTLVANLEKVVADFEDISNNLNSGQGTMGKLLNDDQVYVNLERTTKQMEQLLQDMKLNPKRYVHFSVFGKRPKEYEEPKDSLR